MYHVIHMSHIEYRVFMSAVFLTSTFKVVILTLLHYTCLVSLYDKVVVHLIDKRTKGGKPSVAEAQSTACSPPQEDSVQEAHTTKSRHLQRLQWLKQFQSGHGTEV